MKKKVKEMKKIVFLRLPEEIADRIAQISKDTGVSMNFIMLKAIRALLGGLLK